MNVADVWDLNYMINVGYVGMVSVDPYSSEPMYAQLAGILRARITSGELVRLDPLPSESALVQEHGVSRDTVRRAVAVLREEGLVFTVPQRGTFVGPRP
jgi:GntR family transcriptional regulator